MRYFAWAALTVVLAIPAWLYASLAGGATLYEAGDVTAGHAGVFFAFVLLVAGLVAWVANHASRAAPMLAAAAAAVVVVGVVATALTT